MVADCRPGLAVTPVGLPGTVAGTTGFDGSEACPVPTALLAETVKVYDVPFVSPCTTLEVALADAAVTTWLGVEVTL